MEDYAEYVEGRGWTVSSCGKIITLNGQQSLGRLLDGGRLRNTLGPGGVDETLQELMYRDANGSLWRSQLVEHLQLDDGFSFSLPIFISIPL